MSDHHYHCDWLRDSAGIISHSPPDAVFEQSSVRAKSVVDDHGRALTKPAIRPLAADKALEPPVSKIKRQPCRPR